MVNGIASASISTHRRGGIEGVVNNHVRCCWDLNESTEGSYERKGSLEQNQKTPTKKDESLQKHRPGGWRNLSWWLLKPGRTDGTKKMLGPGTVIVYVIFKLSSCHSWWWRRNCVPATPIRPPTNRPNRCSRLTFGSHPPLSPSFSETDAKIQIPPVTYDRALGVPLTNISPSQCTTVRLRTRQVDCYSWSAYSRWAFNLQYYAIVRPHKDTTSATSPILGSDITLM